MIKKLPLAACFWALVQRETHVGGGGVPPPYAQCTFPLFKPLSRNEPGDPQWRGFTTRVAGPKLTPAARRPELSAATGRLVIDSGGTPPLSDENRRFSPALPGGEPSGCGGGQKVSPFRIRLACGEPPSPDGEGFGAAELGGCRGEPTWSAGACPRPTHSVRSLCSNY